ncbi:hypothetical protein BJ996_007217 [Streptomyces phaeogriseichromatogenes]|nr:hypothetical protein [Streptomyces murinus]
MQQEGSIVLGTGGDNSNWSVGSFFEGVMTSGVPSDAADDAVQANIVSAGYGDSTGQTGQLIPGSEISIRATTPCCTNFYIRHQFNAAIISPISPSSSSLDKNDATWIVRQGLSSWLCYSFESRNYPGEFLRHSNYRLYRQPMDGTMDGTNLFRAGATFCPQKGENGSGLSFRSFNYFFGGYEIRHYHYNFYIASDGGPNPWDTTAWWKEDVTWEVTQPWAP